MKLSNKKEYGVSEALNSIDASIIAKVAYDENGVGEIIYDDVANPNNARPTEAEIDAAGVIVKTGKDELDAKAKNRESAQLKAEIEGGKLLGLDTSTEEQELEAILNDTTDLNELKKQKCKKVNKARNAKQAEPVLRAIDGVDKYFDINILDWDNSALSMDDVETIEWICEDNDTVQITKVDILALCGHIRARRTSTVLAGRLQKDEIIALTTAQEVADYIIVF